MIKRGRHHEAVVKLTRRVRRALKACTVQAAV